MKYEITHRLSGHVLFSLETESLELCVEAAVSAKADLSGAYLSGANLSGANLSGAYLFGAVNAELAYALTVIVCEGDIVGWKKLKDGIVAKLLIPKEARRSNAAGRKCRAEYADVLEIIGAEKGTNRDDGNTGITLEYIAGTRVYACNKEGAHTWDENRWNECSSGIHFYITRAEAEAH